jgi:hypothetical protein
LGVRQEIIAAPAAGDGGQQHLRREGRRPPSASWCCDGAEAEERGVRRQHEVGAGEQVQPQA